MRMRYDVLTCSCSLAKCASAASKSVASKGLPSLDGLTIIVAVTVTK